MTDRTAVDYRTTPPSLEPTATAWQAWWEDHDMWDGDMLYADLATAKHHSAVAYVGEEYAWLPGDDPDDEAPDRTLTWELKYGRWRLLDNGQDTGVRLGETRTYAAVAVPAGQAPDTGRDALRERIRRAVCEAEGFAWDSDMLEPDEYGDHADMVLSALIGSDTDLRQAIDHRDYWHGEAMSATTRIIELERKLAAAERTRENADFHLGQEMARRQLAEKETDSLRAELSRMAAAPAVVSAVPGQTDDETQATPCDQPNACDPDTGELCATHEEEKAHADGEHEYCGVTCEVAMPTELMRNSLIAWAPPGGKGILAELERRAAAEQPAAGAQQPKEA